MKSIHDAATLKEFSDRIESLRPDSPRQWGKMNVSQMLAHCSNAIEANLGDKILKRGLMGRIFGKMAKKSVTSDKPFKHGLPTAPGFAVADERDFNKEKQRLQALLKRLSASDPNHLARTPHTFFGPMTGDEWNTLNVKHLEHHLSQFGA